MRPKVALVAVFMFKVFCALVMLIASIFIFYTVGPGLETRYWPVTGKVTPVEVQEVWRGVKFKAEFQKFRDCEYRGISWFKGTPTDFERVVIQLMREPTDTGSPNRPIGKQRAGPWVVSLSKHDFETNSFAQLFHVCHPFWLTVTDFYP